MTIDDLQLRPYQKHDVEALREAFNQGAYAVCYQAPTGSGKTVVFCYIAHHAAQLGNRICILVHRRELLRQASDALTEWGIQHGVIASGLPTTQHLVQVASKDTLVRRRMPYRFDLLVCDEAHHATADTYRAIWRANPGAHLLGVTATPCRLTGAGLGTVFDRMVVGPTVKDLVTAGYLARPLVYAPPLNLNLKGLRSPAGDYKRDQLERLMDQRHITGDVIEHYRRYLNGKPTLVYCASVQHAEHTAALYREAGFRAESVDGKMPDALRDDRIRAIGDGRLSLLMSCDLIGEGLNVPGVYGIQELRPTKSITIHLQHIGRGLRIAPGKTSCIILDHVGNCYRHGLPDYEWRWSLERGAEKQPGDVKAPPMRQCPQCFYAHPLEPVCPACGYVYPPKPVRQAPNVKEGQLKLLTPEEGNEMYQKCKTLSDYHRWAKATGKKPGAAWHAFKRRQASNKLETQRVS